MIQRFLGLSFQRLMLLEKVWLFAPVAIWFSYRPLIGLGQDTTSYYELSITVIYLALLAVVSLPYAWKARHELVKRRSIWLVGAFADLSLLTLFWTPNLLRGVLTVGIIYALFFIFAGALAEQKRLKKLLPAMVKLLVLSAVVMSILAFMQVVAGVWLTGSDILLCAGCVADQFGFVRPNVFAVEPQFFGSLLLAPSLILLSKILKRQNAAGDTVSFLIVVSALFLTLSRGAIFAFGVGALVMYVLHRQELRSVAKSIGMVASSLAIVLVFQGAVAVVNPHVDITFQKAIATSVNQLSLGVINIPTEQITKETVNTKNTPVYDGYVEESTNVRVSLSELAVRTWQSSPLRIVFGVGVGGAGVAMYEKFPDKTDARQIVQNQYLEILLEYGLLGIGVFIGILIALFYSTSSNKWIWGALGAFIFQWNFFSGYPNAIHIYLFFIIFAVWFSGVTHKNYTKRAH